MTADLGDVNRTSKMWWFGAQENLLRCVLPVPRPVPRPHQSERTGSFLQAAKTDGFSCMRRSRSRISILTSERFSPVDMCHDRFKESESVTMWSSAQAP